MIITRGTLQTLYISYNAAYQNGIKQLAPDWKDVAMPVPSGTRKNEYGWLGRVPNVRQWVGPRVVNALTTYAYTVENLDWEDTIEVDRNDIEDDNLGIYAPRFQMLGEAVARHPNTLVYSTLKAGFSQVCYDGQPYFDADHPVLDPNGNLISVANTDSTPGTGAPWFLMDNRTSIKPIILQQRQDYKLVARDRDTDDNVFNLKKFLYGVDARYNTGFGFWQYCWGSMAPLTPDSYGAARDALIGMKGDYGAPIGVMPNILVTGPSNEYAGLQILNAERDQYGATNVWRGTAALKVTPWLA